MIAWRWIVGGGALALGAGVALFGRKEGKSPPAAAPSAAAGPTLPPSEKARADQLIPAARRALAALQAELLAKHNLKTYVGSTRRNEAEQAAIVAKGSSSTKNSWHLLGRAVDLYPYGPDGKRDDAGKHTELFRTMHTVAARHGWRGLAFNADGSKRYITTTKDGKQIKVWDGGHIEFPEGMTFAQAVAADSKKSYA